MNNENPQKRAERLARARAFLDAGRTQIDTAPQAPPSAPRPAVEGSDVGGAGETPSGAKADAAPRPDPTRFGDWEKNGRCIDF